MERRSRFLHYIVKMTVFQTTVPALLIGISILLSYFLINDMNWGFRWSSYVVVSNAQIGFITGLISSLLVSTLAYTTFRFAKNMISTMYKISGIVVVCTSSIFGYFWWYYAIYSVGELSSVRNAAVAFTLITTSLMTIYHLFISPSIFAEPRKRKSKVEN